MPRVSRCLEGCDIVPLDAGGDVIGLKGPYDATWNARCLERHNVTLSRCPGNAIRTPEVLVMLGEMRDA